MGLKTKVSEKRVRSKWFWIAVIVSALIVVPLLTSYAGSSWLAGIQAQASESQAQSEAPEVGRGGEVEISYESLSDENRKPAVRVKLIKTLGLDKLLMKGSLLTASEDQVLFLDDLLAQKLKRLEAASSSVASASTNERSESSPGSGADPADMNALSTSETEGEREAPSHAASETPAPPSEADALTEIESQEALPVYKTQLYDTGILDINDTYVEYVDGFLAEEAPEEGAALWAGSDATEDGFLGYFIGHNPGDFTPVLSLTLGDPITVYDRFGDERTYYVVDTFIVPNTSRFMDIEDRLFGYGESIALQTCLDDNQNFLVVVAA